MRHAFCQMHSLSISILTHSMIALQCELALSWLIAKLTSGRDMWMERPQLNSNLLKKLLAAVTLLYSVKFPQLAAHDSSDHRTGDRNNVGTARCTLDLTVQDAFSFTTNNPSKVKGLVRYIVGWGLPQSFLCASSFV